MFFLLVVCQNLPQFFSVHIQVSAINFTISLRSKNSVHICICSSCFFAVRVFTYRVFLLSLQPHVPLKIQNENKIKFPPRTFTITHLNRDIISRAFTNQYTDFDVNPLLQTSFFCQYNTNTCNFLYYSTTNDSSALPPKKAENVRTCSDTNIELTHYLRDILRSFIQDVVESRDYSLQFVKISYK